MTRIHPIAAGTVLWLFATTPAAGQGQNPPLVFVPRPNLVATVESVENVDTGQPVLRVRISNTGGGTSGLTTLVFTSKTAAWQDVRAQVQPIPANRDAKIAVQVPVALPPGEYVYSLAFDDGIDPNGRRELLSGSFTVPRPPAAVDLWVKDVVLDPGIVGRTGMFVVTVGNHGPESSAGATLHVHGGPYWPDQTLKIPNLAPAGDAEVRVMLQSPIIGSSVEYRLEVAASPDARDTDPRNNSASGFLVASELRKPTEDSRRSTPWAWLWLLPLLAAIAIGIFWEPVRSRVMRIVNPFPDVRLLAVGAEPRSTGSTAKIAPWEIVLTPELESGHVTIALASSKKEEVVT